MGHESYVSSVSARLKGHIRVDGDRIDEGALKAQSKANCSFHKELQYASSGGQQEL